MQAQALFANEKSIRLHSQLETIEKDDVFGNRQLLFSCIRNILDNAIRYTPKDGNVYLRLEQYQNLSELIIENEGDMISEEVLARLGERFYRALGTKTQGSGLGLSICRKIIELHYGRMKFSQSTYGGLKVSIQLKIEQQTPKRHKE